MGVTDLRVTIKTGVVRDLLKSQDRKVKDVADLWAVSLPQTSHMLANRRRVSIDRLNELEQFLGVDRNVIAQVAPRPRCPTCGRPINNGSGVGH